MAPMTSPLLLGHRGTPRLHRENTLAGFQAALDAGLDGVELDVRRLADGTLVIHHDPALWDGRALHTLTRAELAPHPVPTLDEVLSWARDTGAYLNIEIKFEGARPDDRVPRTLDGVREYGLTARTIVSSFSPLVLDAARAYAPEVERGFLFHKRWLLGGLDLVQVVARRVQAVALHPHHSLVDDALMAIAREGNWRVNTWTVNETADVQRLTQLSVHALIGDDPNTLLTARNSE